MNFRLAPVCTAALLALSACGGSPSQVPVPKLAAQIDRAVGEADGVVVITEKNDPNNLLGRQDGYTAAAVLKVTGLDCSDLGVDCGATIERYKDSAGAKSRYEYMRGISKASSMLGDGYDFLNGNTLLRVSNAVKPAVAKELETAFKNPSKAANAAAATAPAPSGPQATVVKAGFGQQDQYVWASALVHNNTKEAGQTVVVSFNLKDANGAVVATGSQTSAFNWADQTVPIATQIDVPNHAKVTSVEATVDIEDTNIGTKSEDWGSFDGAITRGEYGGWQATFHVKNPTAAMLKKPALQSVCMDDKGRIIGGSSDFPDLITPHGEIVVNEDNLYTDKRPATCTAYLTPWM